ncbi:bis(5'-adenosyl)-triphosphatase ENPP4-like [Hydractinia symbiolongicarpus]|uniref:bis(5'-adenosyl)-triphosphatase ENPP4-like n=1 Tax=Hydractinia symbiolongicarpus TaxID=13093 RepID=UPI00254DBFA6|nr:bis(5'-adenosyl)-triphosphatase ENPP4-like [Hydractinia symbiolongicarpus]
MIPQTQLNLIERMKSLLCFVFLSVVLCTIQKKANNKNQKILLVSLDGFRWNFREKTETPNLDKIVNKHGVSVEYVLNVFPTSTLPNHQSIVTGLYPENHGIIDNSFLNPEDGTIFNGGLDSKWWNQSTPIWIENQIQGHESGVCFWPGYQVNYKNKTPSYTPDEKFKAPYETTEKKDMELNDRLDLVIDWLKKDNVTFVALYTECVDETAHDHSPDSNETKSKLLMMKAINTIDEFIGTLQDKLEEEDLKSFVNVIMIGDHGHINTSSSRVLQLDDYVDSKHDLRYISGFTNIFLYTKHNKTKSAYEKLKKGSEKEDSHFKVYLKEDIPEDFHVKKNNRTAPILILPDPGWIMTNQKEKVPYLKGDWKRGEHGYSIYERNMNPGFYAFGPMFRQGYRKTFIRTVDIYSLMCFILNLKPHANDGDFDKVKDVFKGRN